MKNVISQFKNWTIKDILETIPSQLEPIFGDPVVDVEMLLEHTLKCDKTYLYTHLDQRLKTYQTTRFKQMLKKRKKGIPLQYIFGSVQFKNVKITVNKDVLIPRPETELLVDLSYDYIKQHAIRNIVDICTGSGVIIISLAKLLAPTKINYNYIATDISKKAIARARYNALKNGVGKINFRIRNLIHRPNTFIPLTSWVLISNPPYVATKDMNEPSIAFEPKTALDGGEEGLDFYDKILKQVSLLQNKPKAIFFEIGFDQAQGIELLAHKYLEEYKEFTVYKDDFGKDRVIFIEV